MSTEFPLSPEMNAFLISIYHITNKMNGSSGTSYVMLKTHTKNIQVDKTSSSLTHEFYSAEQIPSSENNKNNRNGYLSRVMIQRNGG